VFDLIPKQPRRLSEIGLRDLEIMAASPTPRDRCAVDAPLKMRAVPRLEETAASNTVFDAIIGIAGDVGELVCDS
jgi:hypothetical protein